MTAASVAVVDIGSNSIKLLVARRTPAGALEEVLIRTIDARLGTGISHSVPRLGEEGMARGLAAVQELLAAAAPLSPRETVLVATSAVRDAVNGPEFAARVRTAAGQEIRILSGEEEASYIGAGIVCDPTLQHLRDFHVFDLGGGSLECLAFRNRTPTQAASLPLGCVRLMEKLVPDPTQPFTAELAQGVAEHVWATFEAQGWKFILPAGTPVVGTGGTVSCVRAIAAARIGTSLERTDPVVTVTQLRESLAWLGKLTLEERRSVPGLPPRRADVFPTALATLIGIAECGRFDAFHHSLHNLRWGIAASLLGSRGDSGLPDADPA